jgi:DNA recombination protein RmuC
MVASVVIGIVAIAAVAGVLLLWRLVGRRLGAIEERVLTREDLATLVRPDQLDAQTMRLLDSDQRIVSSTTETFGQLRQQLGSMEAATSQMLEVGRDIAGLENLLKPPQLRGGIGETLLEQLLGQVLPAEHYEMQHGFRDHSRVDAVIKIGGSLVPIDAKFPLDAFRRFLDADNDAARASARREFRSAVKVHVDAVSKYIRPDEGTFGFALMYVPAENVYYETILRDAGDELFTHALNKRVVPVSPNSLYAYLLVIVHGLRGMRIEKAAQDILRRLGTIESDVKQFQADYQVLGGHLRNARTKYEEADGRLQRVRDKLHTAIESRAEATVLAGEAEAVPLPLDGSD